MRPAGEIRAVLFKALKEGPATSRMLAGRACVGFEAARRTLDNMVRAEKVRKLESVRVAGVKRPVPLYALPAPPRPSDWVQLRLDMPELRA